MGIDGSGTVALVADLDLDEPPVHPVLGQVRDVGMPQAMDHQSRRQAKSSPVALEPVVDLRRPDPAAALGHPQRRVAVAAELRADVLHVVGHRLHRPPHHRGDVAAPRRLAPLGLAVADVQHPVPAELRRGRVAAPVREVELRRLGPPKPPGVNHLEQRRVPVGSQRPLAFRAYGPVNLTIGIIQETLQLLAGERPRLRPALIPVEVGDRVPLMADRHRVHTRPELVLAGRGPAIPAIAEVLAEQPQIRLVAPDRRRSQTLLRHQRLRPLLHVRRNPAPRVLVGELQEPADQPLPRRYRVLPQPARRLLSPPAAQHRLEHRVLRPQLHHPGHQLQMRRTSQITSPQPALQPQK